MAVPLSGLQMAPQRVSAAAGVRCWRRRTLITGQDSRVGKRLDSRVGKRLA
jgi:hypothetical protein